MNLRAIKKEFTKYVESMGDKERHTKSACSEVDEYDRFCEEVFSDDIRLQECFYEKMMNVAVEFEESGFIAGFRIALSLMPALAIEEV